MNLSKLKIGQTVVVAEEIGPEDLSKMGEYKLIKAPGHVGAAKPMLGKKAKFKGDEMSLKWGSLLLGEEENGNIRVEVEDRVGPGSLKEISIIAPEGKYVFVEARK